MALRSAYWRRGGLPGVDVLQVQAPAEHRFDVTVLVRLPPGAIHVGPHAGVAGEVAVDVALGLVAADAQLARQPESGHAIDEAEVDGLGGPALVSGHAGRFDAEHLGGGGLVDVLVSRECLEQALITGDVRHDAQLDL